MTMVFGRRRRNFPVDGRIAWSLRPAVWGDSGVKPFITQQIEYTDFPLPELDIWAGANGEGYTLMLKREY